jgi:hypothetical protein
MKYLTSTLLHLVLVSGCVSNKAIQTVQAGDQKMSCVAIKFPQLPVFKFVYLLFL